VQNTTPDGIICDMWPRNRHLVYSVEPSSSFLSYSRQSVFGVDIYVTFILVCSFQNGTQPPLHYVVVYNCVTSPISPLDLPQYRLSSYAASCNLPSLATMVYSLSNSFWCLVVYDLICVERFHCRFWRLCYAVDTIARLSTTTYSSCVLAPIRIENVIARQLIVSLRWTCCYLRVDRGMVEVFKFLL
jgi:hypothetical protein